MLKTLRELFGNQLSLSGDIWLYVMLGIVVLAFAVTLIVGLTTGMFNKIKAIMKRATAKPEVALVAMKQLPAPVKAQYKNARMGNIKPSMLVTKQLCVDEPYKRSFISKVWLVTFMATVICALMAFFVMPLAKVSVPSGGEGDLEAAIDAMASVTANVYIAPFTVLALGGLLTVIGGIVGKLAYSGAVKTYGKFIPVLDGEQRTSSDSAPAYSSVEPQQAQTYAEPQQAYAEPQQAYAESVQTYEPQQEQVYAEPQQAQAYAEPQQAYAQPIIEPTPQESEEEQRRRAREEALAQMRAQQAQAQARQTPPPQQAQPQQQAFAQTATADSASVDDVIARIDKIEREGASRETMREVASLLQKERAKPENKTPERQRRLNEALSKLLKAMSGARK